MSLFVTVADKRFPLNGDYTENNVLILTIPSTEDYMVVKNTFLHNTDDICVWEGAQLLKTYRDFTKLANIVDSITEYALTLEKEYNDEEALKVLASARVSLSEAKALRANLESVASDIPDEKAADDYWMFPAWAAGVAYSVGDRIQYGANLYKVIQAHTSQADWTPDVAQSLYTRIGDPTVEWPEWIQPTGAHNAYAKGDKVSHNNKHWISNVDANVWEPGVYGWDEAE